MQRTNKRKDVTHPHFVAVRLTDAEMALLDQGASTLGISRSEYLRKILLDKEITNRIEVVADMDQTSIRLQDILTPVEIALRK